MTEGTTGPYPRLTPRPTVRDMNSTNQRRTDPYDKYRDGCGLCHGIYGFFESWVVAGVGLRSIHPACAEVLSAMGMDLREERRSK